MIRLSPAAALFVRTENDYLRVRSRDAAQRFLADISEVRQLLHEHPFAGAELDLLRGTPLEGMRRWVKGAYTFDYRVAADGTILVVLIRHHAQDDPHHPFDADDSDMDYD